MRSASLSVCHVVPSQTASNLVLYVMCYLLTSFLSYLLAYFLIYLLTYFVALLLSYLLTLLLAFLLSYFLTFLLIYLLSYLFIYLLSYLITYFLNYFLTYLLTYLLTPCSTVLLEKLTVPQLIKKFPTFYGTRRFITVIHKCPPPGTYPEPARSSPTLTSHFLKIHLNIILHLRLSLPSGLFLLGFPTKTLYKPLFSSPIHATCTAHLIHYTSRIRTIVIVGASC